MTGELWMCLGLVVLLITVITQNMSLQDRLKQIEAKLEWMTNSTSSQAKADTTDSLLS